MRLQCLWICAHVANTCESKFERIPVKAHSLRSDTNVLSWRIDLSYVVHRILRLTSQRAARTDLPTLRIGDHGLQALRTMHFVAPLRPRRCCEHRLATLPPRNTRALRPDRAQVFRRRSSVRAPTSAVPFRSLDTSLFRLPGDRWSAAESR